VLNVNFGTCLGMGPTMARGHQFLFEANGRSSCTTAVYTLKPGLLFNSCNFIFSMHGMISYIVPTRPHNCKNSGCNKSFGTGTFQFKIIEFEDCVVAVGMGAFHFCLVLLKFYVEGGMFSFRGFILFVVLSSEHFKPAPKEVQVFRNIRKFWVES
jgi:hypothetical protein